MNISDFIKLWPQATAKGSGMWKLIKLSDL